MDDAPANRRDPDPLVALRNVIVTENAWVVEYVDEAGDLHCTKFTGPDAESRARRYMEDAIWRANTGACRAIPLPSSRDAPRSPPLAFVLSRRETRDPATFDVMLKPEAAAVLECGRSISPQPPCGAMRLHAQWQIVLRDEESDSTRQPG